MKNEARRQEQGQRYGNLTYKIEAIGQKVVNGGMGGKRSKVGRSIGENQGATKDDWKEDRKNARKESSIQASSERKERKKIARKRGNQ